jgi:hypothetical protein
MWSNIGMCFAAKGKHVAAVACLKRAQYLDPFQFGTAHNLGLVHLRAECYASAFVYLNAAASMNPAHVETLLYLAVALARLDDEGNARAAYARAASVAAGDRAVGAVTLARLHLNYAVTLFNWGDVEGARAQWGKLEAVPVVSGARRAPPPFPQAQAHPSPLYSSPFSPRCTGRLTCWPCAARCARRCRAHRAPRKKEIEIFLRKQMWGCQSGKKKTTRRAACA